MKKVILIFHLILNSILLAQNPDWINYTNGNSISSIAEEVSDIWVGTNGGLLNINKISEDELFYNRSNSGLPDNYVTSIEIDSEGTKWIGTFRG